MTTIATRHRRPGKRQPGAETHDDDQNAARMNLAHRVADEIRRMGLTQAEAARLLDLDQPKVSRLLNRRLEEFSPSRLMRFLVLLGRDIDIVVGPAAAVVGPKRTGTLRVVSREGALQ